MSQNDHSQKLEVGKALIGCLSAVLVACISGAVALVTNWDKVEKVLTQVSPSNTLYQEEFTSLDSGWDVYQDDEGNLIEYSQGAYRIFVNEANISIGGSPGVDYSNVSIQVTTQYLAGPQDNLFGIECRYQNPDNYYEFAISSDGYYGIGKRVNGDFSWLGEKLEQSDYIHTGDRTNQINAVCDKDLLSLSVNGHKVMEIRDGEITGGGDIALFAEAIDEVGVDIAFDHLKITKP